MLPNSSPPATSLSAPDRQKSVSEERFRRERRLINARKIVKVYTFQAVLMAWQIYRPDCHCGKQKKHRNGIQTAVTLVTEAFSRPFSRPLLIAANVCFLTNSLRFIELVIELVIETPVNLRSTDAKTRDLDCKIISTHFNDDRKDDQNDDNGDRNE